MYRVFCPSEHLSIIRLDVLKKSALQLYNNLQYIENAEHLHDITIESMEIIIESLQLISVTEFKFRRQLQDCIDDYKSDIT